MSHHAEGQPPGGRPPSPEAAQPRPRLAGLSRMDARRVNRLATWAVLPLLALGVVLVSRYANPATATVAPPASGRLVVANLRDHSLTFFDFAGPGASRRLQLPGPPHELAMVGGRVYVTLGRANALVEVDPAGPAILRTLELGGSPHGLAVDGGDLMVTLDDDDVLVRVNRERLVEVARTPVGDTPHAVAAAAGTVYVVTAGANAVEAYGPGGERRAAAGAVPEAVALGGDLILVAAAGAGRLEAFARDTLVPTFSLAVGPRPGRVLPLGDGRAAVSLGASERVTVIALSKPRVERTLPVDPAPDGLCASGDRNWLAVVSGATGSIDLFAMSNGWRVARAPRGVGPGGGSCLWLD